MKIARPREPKTTLYVQVTDMKTKTSKTQTYYEGSPEDIFEAIDATCEDAPSNPRCGGVGRSPGSAPLL